MSGLNSTAGWAVNAALTGVTLIPLGTFLALDQRGRVQHQSQASKLAHLFLRIAIPLWMVGVMLAVVAPAVVAGADTITSEPSLLRAYRAAQYTAVTATFVISAASILTTLAIYLTSIGALYVVLAKPKWWKLIRLDALCGSALFFIILIAWWARNLVLASRRSGGLTLTWLLDIFDVCLCLLAAGVVGLAIYVTPKMKERSHLGVGNVSALLLSASVLWLFRCCFVLAVHIKETLDEWDFDELQAQKIIYPILDLWVSATVLGLLTFIMRLPVWSNPAAFPADLPADPPVQQVVYVQQPVYIPHPQYGHQQYQPVYQQYPQQPVPYAPQPVPLEVSSTPVPTTRVYEADGAAQGAQVTERQAAGAQQAAK